MKNFVYRMSAHLCLGLCMGAMLLVQTSLPAAEPTEAQIKALIEQLASTNEPPPFRGPDAAYPASYEKKAQNKVWDSYRKLEKLGPVAIEQLIQYTKDERYSLTGDAGSADKNFTVGFLCRWLIESQIAPFEKTVAGDGFTRGDPVHGPGSRRGHELAAANKTYLDELRQGYVEGPRGRPPLRPDFLKYLENNPDYAKKWITITKMGSLPLIQQSVLDWMITEEAKDLKTYDEVERAALKGLLREMYSSGSALHSSKWFLSK